MSEEQVKQWAVLMNDAVFGKRVRESFIGKLLTLILK